MYKLYNQLYTHDPEIYHIFYVKSWYISFFMEDCSTYEKQNSMCSIGIFFNLVGNDCDILWQ